MAKVVKGRQFDGARGYFVEVGTFTANPASIASGAVGTVEVEFAGLGTEDIVIVTPVGDNDLSVSAVEVTAENELTVSLLNSTGGAVDAGELTFNFVAYHIDGTYSE